MSSLRTQKFCEFWDSSNHFWVLLTFNHWCLWSSCLPSIFLFWLPILWSPDVFSEPKQLCKSIPFWCYRSVNPSLHPSTSVRVYIDVIKFNDPETTGGKGLTSSSNSQDALHHWGTQGRNLEAGTGTEANIKEHYWLAPQCVLSLHTCTAWDQLPEVSIFNCQGTKSVQTSFLWLPITSLSTGVCLLHVTPWTHSL